MNLMNGRTNWQLLGSQKPGNKKYMLKYYYNADYVNGDWELREESIEIDYKSHFSEFSVRTMNVVKWKIASSIQDQYDKNKLVCTKKKPVFNTKKTSFTNVREITCEEELTDMVNNMIENITPLDYVIKETHDYTMCLNKTYWGPGSYSKWIKVGWALKNTHEKLLLTWLKFSSQSESFSYSDISSLCDNDSFYMVTLISLNLLFISRRM